jgi:hypothetical protein
MLQATEVIWNVIGSKFDFMRVANELFKNLLWDKFGFCSRLPSYFKISMGSVWFYAPANLLILKYLWVEVGLMLLATELFKMFNALKVV